jgi:hypothetical protein
MRMKAHKGEDRAGWGTIQQVKATELGNELE